MNQYTPIPTLHSPSLVSSDHRSSCSLNFNNMYGVCCCLAIAPDYMFSRMSESDISQYEKAKLPPLPDFILEKIGGKKLGTRRRALCTFERNVCLTPCLNLVAAGVQFGFHSLKEWTKKEGAANRIQDDGGTTPSQSFITQDLKAQILAGNYQALTDARNAAQNDLQANVTTINNSTDGNAGFVTVVNSSNGREYKICASNAGWIWSYTTSITVQATEANATPQTQCVVQTGTYSANGKILGLSYQTLTNVPTALTALAASVIVSYVVGNFIKNLILGAIYQAALDAAVAAAAAEAVAGGIMISEAAASIGATIVATLGAGVVGIIVAIAIYYLSDFLHRSYGLTISIYNWDANNAWDVSNWYADNAVVAQNNAGSGPWKAVNLLPVQSGPL